MKAKRSILSYLRNSRAFRYGSIATALLFFWEMARPTVSFALTGGPSQPEVNSFSPAGTSDLVNPYTGDFSYSLPLMDVGGYPIALSYQSGISMDQEASMVGLGWNLNTGAITRNLRGIPDEFRGDGVTREYNMKPMISGGASLGTNTEVFGLGDNAELSANGSINIGYSNYNGITFNVGAGPEVGLAAGTKGQTVDLGLSFSSGTDGLTLTPSLGLSGKHERSEKENLLLNGSVGLPLNNRQGITNLNVNAGVKDVLTEDGKSNTQWRGGHGVGISFVNNAYTPQIQFPFTGVNYQLAFKNGIALFGGDASASISGYYSQRELSTNSRTVAAYGYKHNKQGAAIPSAMLDFNREKDAAFGRHTVNLPVTNLTYDIYSIQAQGIGGSFRPYLSDVGYVHDMSVYEYATGADLEVEADFLATADGGVAFTQTLTSNESGTWTEMNDAIQKLYGGNDADADVYEPYYYQMIGDLSVDDQPWLKGNSNTPYNTIDQYFNTDAVQLALKKEGTHQFTLTDDLKSHANANITRTLSTANTKRTTRRPRNTSIHHLTRAQAEDVALNPEYIPSSSDMPDHHPAEYTILQGDGSRYIFGLPAMNSYQKDVTFNTGSNSAVDATGLVSYTAGTDNSIGNEHGLDHYYDATILPPYAHSHMLTAVVSADYSDVDDIQGPSPGDYGSYTKFTYGDVVGGVATPNVSDYRWRTPYDSNKALYNEGLKTSGPGGHDDDKGNYTYGIKDLWYPNTIETKTHVAVFNYEDRKDARGVKDENGGVAVGGEAKAMQKLVRIDLYSLPVYQEWQEAGGPAPQAIQSVHFEYDYSLCQGLPTGANAGGTDSYEDSNQGGKLTLKKVWFTYEGSLKHQLNPYQFTYNSGANGNPNYNPKAMDVWGVYRENEGDFDATDVTGVLNAEFPYIDQSTTTRNDRAAAWCMTKITTPSGGEIEITYESDDYALVQDKVAMQMHKITKAGGSADYASATTELYDGADPHEYLFFDVPSSYTSTELNKMWDVSLNRLMHFRFLLDLDHQDNFDYVEGWCEVEAIGKSSDDATKAYVKIKPVNMGDRENDENGTINPISKAGWNFGRLHNPRLVYQLQDPDDSDAQQLVKALVSVNVLQNVIDMVLGVNRRFRQQQFSQEFRPNKSWVRLYCEDGKKLGGGHRVSEVRLNDDWNYNTGGNHSDFEYGTSYTYEMPDGSSSGVANYEPLSSKENPLVQPVVSTVNKALAPDDVHYQTTPFGESFMPSPGVGYRRVEVRALERTNVTRHATGHSVNEYYTAYDFPTQVKQTKLAVERSPRYTNALGSAFSVRVRDFVAASQGYTVEKFDHFYGNPKRVTVYGEGQTTPISKQEYLYDYSGTSETTAVNGESHAVTTTRSDNQVITIHPNGEIKENETVGVDVDIVMDFREHNSEMITSGANGNLAAFIAAFLPGFVPTILPTVQSEETKLRTAVTTKVINRYPVLREVRATDLGSTVSTRNLAWDSETGNVLLTATTNEFNDTLYSLSYPAHWAYDLMGQGYRNILLGTEVTTDANGMLTGGQANLVPGDEVLYNGTRYWVVDGTSPATGSYLVNQSGGVLANLSQDLIHVLRSGRRNQQAIGVGSVVLKESPIHASNGTLLTNLTVDGTKKVLQSQSAEFSETWKTVAGAPCPNPAPEAYTLEAVSFINQMINVQDIGNGTVETNLDRTDYTGYTDLYDEMGTDYGACSEATMVNQSSPSVSEANYLFSCSTSTCNFHIRIIDAVSDGNDLTNIDHVQLNMAFYMAGNTSSNLQLLGTWDGVTKRMEVVGTTCLDLSGSIYCDLDNPCEIVVGDEVNPYVENLRGVFRPLRSLVTLEDRVQHADAMELVGNNNQINLRDEGHFASFSAFWQYDGGTSRFAENSGTWTWAGEASDFLPYGIAVENRDALYRYSAELVGYNFTLPIAMASNSSYQQIGFDGFEDYGYLDACQAPHLISTAIGATLQENIAHTGRYSYPIAAGESYVISASLQDAPTSAGVQNVPYTVKDHDVVKRFGPQTYNLQTGSDEDRRYVVSFWMKAENTADAALTDYTNGSLSVAIDGAAVVAQSSTRSEIIEGWQRVEALYAIPGGSDGELSIAVYNSHSSDDLYLDDIRIHPLNASFKSVVYDPVSLRLWAELDNNNFATFYEYDEQGHLARVKKETVRGIVTLQESRQSIVKTNP